MDNARRQYTLIVMLLALMVFSVACAPAATPSAAPQSTATSDTAFEPTEAAPESGGATRTVTDALGNEVEIPAEPQRVLAQDYLGELLAVGITPVGAPDRFYDESDLYTDYLTDVERIGDANTPNVEKILTLQPDLILVNQYLGEDVIEQLTQIAPTILVNDEEEALARLERIAAIVGKEDEAQAWITSYTQQQEEVRQQLASAIEPGEKALILTTWQDIIWVQATRSIGQTIYTTLGFSPTDKIAADVEAIMSGANTSGQSGYLEISLETLPEYAADADRLFVLVSNDEESQRVFQTFDDNAIWQSLPAVQNDQVYLLSPRWGWYNPIGLSFELSDSVNLLVESQ